jgi:TM2 domain-containing membrane protein YozV
MNCQNHPEIPATAYCRTCGKPVCEQCRRDAHGTVFCTEHIPATAGAPAPPPASGAVPPSAIPASYPRADVSPGLALFLGFIPGVGAIYNGQYVKGLVHAVIFGVIISILDSGSGGLEVVMSMLLTAWIFYMAFEAQHTAQKRRNGEPVDEYSSVLSFRGGNNAPVAGIVLVVLGALLLLNTLNLVNFAYLERYWPALLIAAGVYLLYTRLGGEK